jgi:hypothetical protein
MLAALDNPDTTTTALDTSTDEDVPEMLVVEPPELNPCSRFRIKIVRVPGRAGGYIIAPCNTKNWRLAMETRLDSERAMRALEERRRELKKMIDAKWST